MSLLADLLSRVKQPQSYREVPPNLKAIVRAATGHAAGKKRLILLSGAFLLSIASGVLAVQFVTSYINASSPYTQPAAEVSHAVREAAVQTPDSDSGTAAPVSHTETQGKDTPKPVAAEDKTAAKTASEPSEPAIPDEEEEAFARQWPAKNESTQKQEDSEPAETESVSPESSQRAGFLYAARKAEMNHEYMNALKNFRSALAIDRNNQIVMNSIAFLYLRLNLPDEALTYAEMALKEQSDYVPALTNAAIAQARLGNFSASEQTLLRANRLAPDDDAVLLNLAILKERQKEYEAALFSYQKLKKLGRIEGYLGEARLYELQGDTQRALSLYRALSSMDSLDQDDHTRVRQRILILQDTQTVARPTGG